MRLQHIGIVACSPEGAALCYRTICVKTAELLGAHINPQISMHMHSFADHVKCLNNNDWDGVAALMVDSANKLASIGADFLICPDNTVHEVLPDVKAQTNLPWLHIAEVVADEATKRGFRRPGIIGTRWLVDSEIYPEQLKKRGMEYLRPTASDRDEIDRIILNELVYGVFKPGSVEFVCACIDRMRSAGCDSIVLGCTELPLIINEQNSALPPLASTNLLAHAAVRTALSAPHEEVTT